MDGSSAARSVVSTLSRRGKEKRLSGRMQEREAKSSKSFLTVIVFPPQPSGEQPPQGSSFPAPSLSEG